MKATKQSANVERDPRWAAVEARERGRAADFFYAVTTTGVYCRPWCWSRLPRPEHVRFFGGIAEAQRAGFRPCKRCKPDREAGAVGHAEEIRRACRALEAADRAPRLAELAKAAGLSESHFHRSFKAATGVTPKQYAAAKRAERVRSELRKGGTVTDAVYESGYQSNGRFYAESGNLLGMTPGKYRAGGKSEEIRFAVGKCSLGSILVARSERGVCAILLGDDPAALAHDLKERFPQAKLLSGDAAFQKLVTQVVGLIETPRNAIDLPLDVRGTAFQQRVWQALRKIPAGSHASYAEIAQRIGAPKAVRAVAQACSANPLAVAIPCHRVVRSDGALSGYRWGSERKQALLDRETANNSQ